MLYTHCHRQVINTNFNIEIVVQYYTMILKVDERKQFSFTSDTPNTYILNSISKKGRNGFVVITYSQISHSQKRDSCESRDSPPNGFQHGEFPSGFQFRIGSCQVKLTCEKDGAPQRNAITKLYTQCIVIGTSTLISGCLRERFVN